MSCWTQHLRRYIMGPTRSFPLPAVLRFVALFLFIGAACTKCEPGVSPVAYTVLLKIGKGVSFDFETTITIRAEKAGIQTITLHCQLSFVSSDIQVTGLQNTLTKIHVEKSLRNEAEGTLEIVLQEPLTAGYSYDITLRGSNEYASADSEGLFLAEYRERNSSSWFVALRSSPTAARKVFPCFDTAADAAPFELRIWRPSTHVSISNAPLNSSEQIGPGLHKDTFHTTFPLAPHQLALVVGPFVVVQEGSATVWGRPSILPELQRAAQDVSAMMKEMESLTAKPRGNLTVVALPGVRDAAAEATGVLALAEANVAYGERLPASAGRGALLSLARGVSHPWGYSLSRPSSWSQAWVARAVAEHLQYRVADKVDRTWRFAEQQLAYLLQDVYEESTVRDPPSTTAPMAAVVLRMLEYTLNRTVFDQAILKFYSRVSNKAITFDDLSDVLSMEAEQAQALPPGVMVYPVLATWTEQAGYPVATVIRDYQNGLFEMTQERFHLSPSDRQFRKVTESWWLPVRFAVKFSDLKDTNEKTKSWFAAGDASLELGLDMPSVESEQWVYFNELQLAPYRVNYDTHNWLLLSGVLQDLLFERLPPVARAQLVGDALTMARAARLDYVFALELTQYLHQEGDLIPWAVTRRGFKFLEERLAGASSPATALLRKYASRLIRSSFLDAVFDFGFAQDNDQRLLAEVVIPWAGELGLAEFTTFADKAYGRWVSDKIFPMPEVVGAVLCYQVRRRGEEPLSFAMEVLHGSVLDKQREQYIHALSCTANAPLRNRVMSLALDEVPPFVFADFEKLLVSMSSQVPDGWEAVALFLNESVQRILERNINPQAVERILSHLASTVSTSAHLTQVSQLLDLFDDHHGSLRSSKGVQRALRAAESNLEWMHHLHDDVADWLWCVVRPDDSRTETSTAETSTAEISTSETSTAETSTAETSTVETSTTMDTPIISPSKSSTLPSPQTDAKVSSTSGAPSTTPSGRWTTASIAMQPTQASRSNKVTVSNIAFLLVLLKLIL